MSGKPKLTYADITAWQGLYTKHSPDLLTAEKLSIAENCDFFETYGALGKINGTARVLSSPYTESGSAKKIPWIDFYKTSDLDGTILRHTLVAAGTILGRIDSGAITTLETGKTENLFYDADRLDKFMFITNQNPDRVGEGDKLVKYDGAVITNWGVTPPGSQETVREAFDDKTDWTTANVTVTDERASDGEITWDGDAIRLDKTVTTTGSRVFHVERAFDSPFYAINDERDSSRAAQNRVNFFTYIPRGELTADNLSSDTFSPTEGAMVVWVSPDANTILNNHWKFYFSIGDLVEGWNKLQLDFTRTPVGLSGKFYPENQVIKRMRWDFRLKDDADLAAGIRLDRLQTLDEGNPIVTASGVGAFSSGSYKYKVSFISKYGHESNAGPATSALTVSNNSQLNLTNIPLSSDPQVIARRLYRTVANGSIYLFLDTIPNNTRTVHTDTTPDGSLGTTTPPQAGDFSDDNSIPPQAGIVTRWKRTLFMAGDPQNPETLYYSEDDEPESFPLLNVFVLDSKITAIYESYSILVVETETGKWQLQGDNPDFSMDKIIDSIGCVGRRAAGKARRIGYAVDRDGMRLFAGDEPLKISEPIRDKYDTLNKANIELIHTVHSKNKNVILQFNPDGTTPIPTYDEIFVWTYLIDDPTEGVWSTMNPPSGINFLAATEVEDSNGAFLLYASGDDGMVYELFNSDSKNWVDANGATTAIKTKFQTPYVRWGEVGAETYLASGTVTPRFIEVRLKNNTAMTWTVTCESADGSSQAVKKDTKTINLEFGVNNSLIRQAFPQDFHPGQYIRFTLENEEKDTGCEITGVRVYFTVRPFDGEIIDVDTTT